MVDSSEKAFLKQLPDFRTYEDGKILDLPFTRIFPGQSGGPPEYSLWHVPHNLEPLDAFHLGYEYAAHLAQYFKDNPSDRDSTVLLLEIIKEMGGSGARRGESPYEHGFFTYVAKTLRARAESIDLHEDMARTHEEYMRFRETLKAIY